METVFKISDTTIFEILEMEILLCYHIWTPIENKILETQTFEILGTNILDILETKILKALETKVLEILET